MTKTRAVAGNAGLGELESTRNQPRTGVTTLIHGNRCRNADRMSFGLPPTSFAPDGMNDYVLQLTYTDTAPVPVPEPGSAILLLTALSPAAFALRKRMPRLK